LEGVLAQAKNGDELFWEEKFHAANGRLKHALKVPCFFFLLTLAGGRSFIHFSQVPNVFPNMFSESLTFIPDALADLVLLSPI
jgi:hypothetical protein